jgi:hypothetical protein
MHSTSLPSSTPAAAPHADGNLQHSEGSAAAPAATATYACYGSATSEMSALVLSLATALALIGVGGCVAALATFRLSREMVKRKGCCHPT